MKKRIMKYVEFIDQTFQVQGLNESRTVRIDDVYAIGRHPIFKCIVIGDYEHFADGQRENILCAEVVQNGQLKPRIRVLTA